MIGPGKYDLLATALREATEARAVLVIVLDGKLGSGFSCQVQSGLAVDIPGILRSTADQIEKDNEREGKAPGN